MIAKNGNKESQAQLIEWIEETGRKEYIVDARDRYDEIARRMSERQADLVEKYPDRWVAMTEREELIVAGSSEEIIADIDARGIDRNAVVMKFIRGRRRRMIL